MKQTTWVNTNIRLPEDVYMDLKLTAAKQRTSIAALIRQRISSPTKSSTKTQNQTQLKKLKSFAKKMAKKNQDINLSDKLIEMRYKQ